MCRFSLASTNGCPKGLNNLGLMYFHGKGVIKQPEIAYQKFIQASQWGDADACNNAGICLEQGIGIEKSIHDALRYYHLGARTCS